MKRLIILLFVNILFLAACNTPVEEPAATATPAATEEPPMTETPTPAPTETPPVPPTLTGPVIIFEQSGGFAGITQSWTIYADGHVEGDPSTNTQLPPDQVAQVLAEAEADGFFELDDAFLPEDHCCDFLNYTITLTHSDGHTHTIETMQDAPGMPPALQEAIRSVNFLLFMEQIEE